MLGKSTFNKLVKNPASASRKEREALAKAADKYPYCQWLTIIPEHTEDKNSASQEAVVVKSNESTDTVFSGENLKPSKVTEILSQIGEKKGSPSEKEIKNVLKAFLNEYKSEQKETTAPTREPHLAAVNKILNRLADTENKKKKRKEDHETADLSVKSVQEDQHLISENLAKILASQGKNEKALAMYEKLILKFPEKNAYFANRIKELEIPQ